MFRKTWPQNFVAAAIFRCASRLAPLTHLLERYRVDRAAYLNRIALKSCYFFPGKIFVKDLFLLLRREACSSAYFASQAETLDRSRPLWRRRRKWREPLRKGRQLNALNLSGRK